MTTPERLPALEELVHQAAIALALRDSDWSTFEQAARIVLDTALKTHALVPYPPGGSQWRDDQLAYNGQSHPLRRLPTPLERDFLCRILRDLQQGQITVLDSEMPLIPGLIDALDPREDADR